MTRVSHPRWWNVMLQKHTCNPNIPKVKEKNLREAHRSKYIMQIENIKMYHDLLWHYWWNGMKSDIALFIYLTSQQVKVDIKDCRNVATLLVPIWKWEPIQWIVRLPRTRNQHHATWVIVDKLSSHFLAIKMTYSLNWLAQLYIREIAQLHDLLASIVTDRDPRFASQIWESLQRR